MSITLANASTDNISHGSNASLDDLSAFTVLFWLNPTALATFRTLLVKEIGGTTGLRIHTPGTGSGFIRVARDRSGGELQYITNNQALTIDKWWCVAVTMDLSAGAGQQVNVYIGDLTTPLVESTYSTATDSTGSASSEAAGSLKVGDHGGTQCFGARYAFFGMWNRALTLAELKAQQFRPHKTSGCVVFSHYGFNGTGTQPDWSGNGNNGTLTGGTVSEHVPVGAAFAFENDQSLSGGATADEMELPAGAIVMTLSVGGGIELVEETDGDAGRGISDIITINRIT